MRFRVWLLTIVVVLANVGGNAILGYAMKQAPATAGIIGSILQPVAMLGIVVLTAWMLLRMRLLGLADLSFVVPVTAIGYVLSALAGVLLLHEHVPLRGWIGTVIIMAGATLTGLTEHSDKPLVTPAYSGQEKPQ
jgi:drug/metabolite transporter (DMT)-like permease